MVNGTEPSPYGVKDDSRLRVERVEPRWMQGPATHYPERLSIQVQERPTAEATCQKTRSLRSAGRPAGISTGEARDTSVRVPEKAWQLRP